MNTRAAGFTLIEVMVALVVFAVLGFAVSARIGDVVNQTYNLERRSVAHWIATNQLHRLRMEKAERDQEIATGRSKERVRMSGREWLVDVDISATTYPSLRRVDLSVFLVDADREIGPLEHLTGFLGQY